MPIRQAWHGSHHDLAMQEPSASRCLAMFDNASFTKDGVQTQILPTRRQVLDQHGRRRWQACRLRGQVHVRGRAAPAISDRAGSRSSCRRSRSHGDVQARRCFLLSQGAHRSSGSIALDPAVAELELHVRGVSLHRFEEELPDLADPQLQDELGSRSMSDVRRATAPRRRISRRPPRGRKISPWTSPGPMRAFRSKPALAVIRAGQ